MFDMRLSMPYMLTFEKCLVLQGFDGVRSLGRRLPLERSLLRIQLLLLLLRIRTAPFNVLLDVR